MPHWALCLVFPVLFRCTEVIVRFHDLYGSTTYPTIKKQLILATEVKLQGIISEVNARLIKVLFNCIY